MPGRSHLSFDERLTTLREGGCRKKNPPRKREGQQLKLLLIINPAFYRRETY